MVLNLVETSVSDMGKDRAFIKVETKVSYKVERRISHRTKASPKDCNSIKLLRNVRIILFFF